MEGNGSKTRKDKEGDGSIKRGKEMLIELKEGGAMAEQGKRGGNGSETKREGHQW